MKTTVTCLTVFLCLSMCAVALATPVGSGGSDVAQKTLPVMLDIPPALFTETTALGSGASGPPLDLISLNAPSIVGSGPFTGGLDWIVQSNNTCVREVSWSDIYGIEGGTAAGSVIQSGKLSVKLDSEFLTSNPAVIAACGQTGMIVSSINLSLPWEWSMKPGSYVGSLTLLVRQT